MAEGTGRAPARKTAAKKRARSAAQIDKDVQSLKRDVEEVKGGIDSIVNLLRDQNAQRENEAIQAQVEYTDEPAQYVGEFAVPERDVEDYDEFEEVEDTEEEEYEPEENFVDVRDFRKSGKTRRSATKKKVGERSGDRIVRNLHEKMVRIRLGNPRDPYRVNLEARGTPGDTDQIPASLVNDIGYKRNHGRTFEEITNEEYDALTDIYSGYGAGFQGGYDNVDMSYAEDRTIARLTDVSDPRSRGVGPRYVDAPGSDPLATAKARASAGQEYTAEEVAEYQRIRAQQQGLAMPDPNDPTGKQAMQNLHKKAQRRQNPPRQIAGNDRESQVMAQRLAQMEQGGRAGPSAQGVIPEGELSKPVRLTKGNSIPVSGPRTLDTSGRSRQIRQR